MDNGSVFNAMRFSNHSESGSLMYQASLKGHEGPALVVFSGGTAFNSVAGVLLAWLHESCVSLAVPTTLCLFRKHQSALHDCLACAAVRCAMLRHPAA